MSRTISSEIDKRNAMTSLRLEISIYIWSLFVRQTSPCGVNSRAFRENGPSLVLLRAQRVGLTQVKQIFEFTSEHRPRVLVSPRPEIVAACNFGRFDCNRRDFSAISSVSPFHARGQNRSARSPVPLAKPSVKTTMVNVLRWSFQRVLPMVIDKRVNCGEYLAENSRRRLRRGET